MTVSEECISEEETLRESGISFAMKYLGYVPVTQPVSQMGRELPNALVRHSILSLTAKRDGEEGPVASAFYATIIEEPKFLDIKVILNISSKQITCSHCDKEDDKIHGRNNFGRFLHKHPISMTGIISQIDERKDCVAYISKKANNTQRRCCVFSAEPHVVTKVMDTLKKAIVLSNSEGDASNSLASAISFSSSRNGSVSSGSVTPSVTPSGSVHEMFIPAVPTRISPRPAPPPPSNNLVRGPRASSLIQYSWYHGVLSRAVAESRMEYSGDFLIRESENQVDQVILSAVCDGGLKKHLLLIDKDGTVKTEDSEFRDVAALVDYFLRSQKAVQMADDLAPILKRPIPRPE